MRNVPTPPLPRRCFQMAMAGGLLTGCNTGAQTGNPASRLLARPGKTAAGSGPGLHPLKIRDKRDSLLYVPPSVSSGKAAPLLIYLHGAAGSEQQGIKRLSGFADELGFLLLSPASQGGTWDAIQDSYGPDVRIIDRALARTFETRLVDERKIAVSGFSDGATYALGLGLANGGLFESVVAFSPGFIPSGATPFGNRSRIFISHGTQDAILPIENCSRRFVPRLTQTGYTVTYREFDGPHTVPVEIAGEALRWFLQRT